MRVHPLWGSFLGLVAVAGCADRSPFSPLGAGAVAQSLEAAARANGLPPELLVAIAAEEGGLTLPAMRSPSPEDHLPIAGRLELRHGAFNSLARGAALLGVTEALIEADTDRGTEAGARVVAELGHATFAHADDLASFEGALEQLSGFGDTPARRAYAQRVLARVKEGGTFPAHGGEEVVIAPHPELRFPELGESEQAVETPDYPGAIWFTTGCTNKCTVGRPLGAASVNRIIIHDTEGGWDASVATLQNPTPPNKAGHSVHYIVDADGSRVGQFRHETDTTWHDGNYYYNETSVGIEHVGVAADAAGYATAMYETSAQLVKSIRTRHTIPLDRSHIIGHDEVPDPNTLGETAGPCVSSWATCKASGHYGGADHHVDPGQYFMWCQYMDLLGGSCRCSEAHDLWNCTTDHTEAYHCVSGKVQIAHCGGGCQVKPLGQDDVCIAASDGGFIADGGIKVEDDDGGGVAYGDDDAGGQSAGLGSQLGGRLRVGGAAGGCSSLPGAPRLPLGGTELLLLAIWIAARRARRA